MKKLFILLICIIPYHLFAQEFEWAIDPKFESAGSFSEGLAPAKLNGKWGYIDKTGKWAIQPIFLYAASFSEGLAGVRADINRKDNGGYIDKTGKWIIKPSWEKFGLFENGCTDVSRHRSENDSIIIEDWEEVEGVTIDKKGNKNRFPVIEGMKLFYSDNHKLGYKDSSGYVLIPPKFDNADNFSEGFAAVSVDDKSYFIDKNGIESFQVDADFQGISSFSNGLCRVQRGNSYGYINKSGIWVIQPIFKESTKFINGLAKIKQDGLFGFIDKSGKCIIPLQFEEASFFNEGIAIVKKNGLYGFITKTGEFLIQPQFVFAENFNEGMACIKMEGGKAGFIKLPAPSIRIKNYVEKKILEWQQKGEFEKTADYQSRATEVNRNAKIQQYTNECVEQLKKEFALNVGWENMQLKKYDADNESFLVQSTQLNDYAIPVPYSEAQTIKNQWSSLKFSDADYYIKDDKFQLAKLTITNPATGKKYIYDSKQPTVYAASNITYNFRPIDINLQQNSRINNSSITETNTQVGLSDVDLNIPTNPQTHSNTFAVIIANENYQKEVKVQYAGNDGKVFYEYCEKTLGIPTKNIHFIQDATFGSMRSEIKWISDVIAAYNGQVKVIFYYAGHGMPNEGDKSAYLLPTDGFSSDYETAIKLDDLYTRLGANPAQSVTVFLDACFSGSIRDNGMLASARMVSIKPKAGSMKGNMIVFSAATGEETAYPYKDKQHGLFSYFLLKKLQETKGDVNYENLSKYIIENVKQQSIVVNQKSQTPQVNTSFDVQGVWKSMKLRQ